MLVTLTCDFICEIKDLYGELFLRESQGWMVTAPAPRFSVRASYPCECKRFETMSLFLFGYFYYRSPVLRGLSLFFSLASCALECIGGRSLWIWGIGVYIGRVGIRDYL
jgi:hypothetical protein